MATLKNQCLTHDINYCIMINFDQEAADLKTVQHFEKMGNILPFNRFSNEFPRRTTKLAIFATLKGETIANFFLCVKLTSIYFITIHYGSIARKLIRIKGAA